MEAIFVYGGIIIFLIGVFILVKGVLDPFDEGW